MGKKTSEATCVDGADYESGHSGALHFQLNP